MINPNYTVDYFEEGDSVFYVPSPSAALNDYRNWLGGGSYEEGGFFDPKMSLQRFEEGIVSSKNERFVFVKYWYKGELQETAKATNPQDLVLWCKKK
jgi:hypothetical protein